MSNIQRFFIFLIFQFFPADFSAFSVFSSDLYAFFYLQLRALDYIISKTDLGKYSPAQPLQAKVSKTEWNGCAKMSENHNFWLFFNGLIRTGNAVKSRTHARPKSGNSLCQEPCVWLSTALLVLVGSGPILKLLNML